MNFWEMLLWRPNPNPNPNPNELLGNAPLEAPIQSLTLIWSLVLIRTLVLTQPYTDLEPSSDPGPGSGPNLDTRERGPSIRNVSSKPGKAQNEQERPNMIK